MEWGLRNSGVDSTILSTTLQKSLLSDTAQRVALKVQSRCLEAVTYSERIMRMARDIYTQKNLEHTDKSVSPSYRVELSSLHSGPDTGRRITLTEVTTTFWDLLHV